MEKIFFINSNEGLGPRDIHEGKGIDVLVPMNRTESFVWVLLHSILICRSLRHHTLLSTKFISNAPYFRTPVGTCASLPLDLFSDKVEN